jgi:hypothetical protein
MGFRDPSDGIPEPGTIVTHLSNILLSHSLDQMLFLALLTSRVDTSKLKPNNSVAYTSKTHHGHSNSMALDKARSIRCRIYLVFVSVRFIDSLGAEEKLTKALMMPAQLPILNCNPVAVVLFPYRGRFVGSQANGKPTQTYSPIATRKQPA